MIARDGYQFIFIGIVITVGLIVLASKYDSRLLFSFSLIMGMLTIFTTFFFRDPQRSFTPGDNILISPADGIVIGIEKIDNHLYVGGESLKISIFLSVFDVHINRVPATGKVDYVKYNPGKFFAAYNDKASHLNEQTEIAMTAKGGQKIIFKQIAGIIARRIVCNLAEGDDVSAGERFGLIRFGSRVELIVPVSTELEVKINDRVAGGKTVIGYLAKLGIAANQEKSPGGSVAEL